MKYQLEINYFLYLLKCAVADIVPKPAEKEINWESCLQIRQTS